MVLKAMQRNVRLVLCVVCLLAFVTFATFPFYWMVITSLKKNQDLYNIHLNPLRINLGVTFEHYTYLFLKTNFSRWLTNTLLVAISSTVISLLISIPAGYALARLHFRGATIFGSAVFAIYLVPPTLLFLPLAQMVARLKLTDRLLSLIVTYPSFMVPFSTWMLTAFFRTIPREVEECAMIDGCSRVQAIRYIVMPLALPGIVTVSLFSFTQAWQEFIYSVAFISSSWNKTLTVGVVGELIRGDVFYWGSLMAAALLGSLPVVVIFVFLMDYYVAGLTAGAIK